MQRIVLYNYSYLWAGKWQAVSETQNPNYPIFDMAAIAPPPWQNRRQRSWKRQRKRIPSPPFLIFHDILFPPPLPTLSSTPSTLSKERHASKIFEAFAHSSPLLIPSLLLARWCLPSIRNIPPFLLSAPKSWIFPPISSLLSPISPKACIFPSFLLLC